MKNYDDQKKALEDFVNTLLNQPSSSPPSYTNPYQSFPYQSFDYERWTKNFRTRCDEQKQKVSKESFELVGRFFNAIVDANGAQTENSCRKYEQATMDLFEHIRFLEETNHILYDNLFGIETKEETK
jgi:hypothetical protein